MPRLKFLLHNLKAYDLVVILFYLILSLLNIIFNIKIEQWFELIILNSGIISFVFIVSYLDNNFKSKTIHLLHYLYVIPLILLTFKELYFMIKPLRGNDYDQLLIEIDRWIFGADPTVVLYQIANPYLTELLQIIYGIFYLLPIILALDFLIRKKSLSTEYIIFSVIYGFFLSFLGYFMLPAIGPRFTLHDFSSTDIELPGLLLTNFLREIVNMGESIPKGTLNPALVVQRDVFPSGHTMITLIVMYLSVKMKSRLKWFFIPVGSLLIFSTVYLRYHYVIDLIAGALFMVVSVWSGKWFFNWWRQKTGKEEFEYKKSNYA